MANAPQCTSKPAGEFDSLLGGDVWGPSLSPAAKLFRKHHADLQIDTWTNKRIKALAIMLGMPLRDLFEFIGLRSVVLIRQYSRQEFWPVTIGLHFYMLQMLYESLRVGRQTNHD